MDTKGIDLTKCNNCRFKAKEDGKEKTGRIQIVDNCVKFWFDYHDELNDTICHIIHMSVYREYGVGDFLDDFEIVPRDPEAYRDWQVDDIIAVGEDKPISLVRHVIMWHKKSASFIAVSGGYRGFPITQEWISKNNIVVIGNAIDNRNMAEEALKE